MPVASVTIGESSEATSDDGVAVRAIESPSSATVLLQSSATRALTTAVPFARSAVGAAESSTVAAAPGFDENGQRVHGEPREPGRRVHDRRNVRGARDGPGEVHLETPVGVGLRAW